MSDRPTEAIGVHSRLLKCALETEDARAYWQHADANGERSTARQAFDEYWFGARSLSRIEVLMANFRARFDAYPEAQRVLHRWGDMDPGTRRLVCHWHLQLADPLYRAFTGEYLVRRRADAKPDITRDLAVKWISEEGPARWTMSTRIQFGSKLLSAAFSAGLVTSNRDPRPLQYPRVEDDALEYLLYLLKGVEIAGTLLDNPYAASVGLAGGFLEERLRRLSGLSFRRQGDLVDFGWRYASLHAWATARVATPVYREAGAAP